MSLEEPFLVDIGKESNAKELNNTTDDDNVRFTSRKMLTSMILSSTTEQAKQVYTKFGNVDFLRPYFDVHPHEVRNRLILSFIPRWRTTAQVSSDFYGPLMLVLSLVALLLLQMKTSEHHIQEGTMMGSALVVCFGYWFGASAFLFCITYLCNTRLSLPQILSMLGYGLTSHCLVLLVGIYVHSSHEHLFFYILWLIFGGLTALRIASVLLHHTSNARNKLVIAGAAISVHLLYLLYLHFAYHVTSQ